MLKLLYIMTIVQNFLTVPINIDPSNRRIDLIHDVLKNKKINAMYLMGSGVDNVIYDPYQNGVALSVMGALGTEDLFLNFVDINNDHCIKDLSFNLHNFSMVVGDNFNEYEINKVIDVYKSYLSFSITNTTEIRRLLLLVIYQTENYNPIDDVVNGAVTVQIKPTSYYQDILLKDYVKEKLEGRKIKRIIYKEPSGYIFSYLDIFTKDGKRIENIPTALLAKSGQREIHLDYLDIDWNKSYFKQRGEYSYEGTNDLGFPTGTVYCYPTLTFIY